MCGVSITLLLILYACGICVVSLVEFCAIGLLYWCDLFVEFRAVCLFHYCCCVICLFYICSCVFLCFALFGCLCDLYMPFVKGGLLLVVRDVCVLLVWFVSLCKGVRCAYTMRVSMIFVCVRLCLLYICRCLKPKVGGGRCNPDPLGAAPIWTCPTRNTRSERSQT